jgi:formamidopyrimidine-DNA glycosylase
MPELPEVETVVRGLREPLVGRTIMGVWTDWPKSLRGGDAPGVAARLHGQTVTGIERRAKYILCQLSGGDVLVVHLKMTGRLYVAGVDDIHDADRWVHVRLDLDGGRQLRFSDARKFGFVSVVTSVADLAPHLGPEPLTDDFTPAYLAAQLKRSRRAIKAMLLDQTFLAGVGNIYADEALFRAGIHPLRTADSLTKAETARLFATIREALNAGIEREGASINWYRKPDGTAGSAQQHFLAYDRAGEPCLTCGTPIEKIRVAQRGTHFCPSCQPARRARTKSAVRRIARA